MKLSLPDRQRQHDAEASLIEQLCKGGSQRRLAEKELFERFLYMAKIARSKYKLSDEECASVYSDTILGLIQNIVYGKFEGRSSLKTYAYQILLNKCVDVVRKNTTNRTLYDSFMVDTLTEQLPDAARNVVQQMIEKANRATIAERIRELGEKCRQLLMLFEDGYSDKEIAAEMNYGSPDVVKTSRLRCLEKLRVKVRNEFYE